MMTLLNADRGSKERIAQIYVVAGGNRVKVEELQAGDYRCCRKTERCEDRQYTQR